MKNRSSASGLIQELQDACHRSLYNGNDLLVGGSSKLGKDWEDLPSSIDNTTNEGGPNKRARREGARGTSSISTVRSWETILTDAANQLPGMSDTEHGQVCHLVSILLLGWFLPGSTGNDFFLLQHRSSLAGVEMPSCFTDATARDLAIGLPLAERLESIPHKLCPSEFGEFDALTDDRFDAAMTSFVVRALGQLLDARPVHTQQVDWLHLIAMAIHPNPSEQPIRQTANHLESKNSSYWEYTQMLMRSLHAPNFAVNYRHRRLLVQLVADHLCLPEMSNPSVPLLEGALPHLRASLYAFGMAAMSPRDKHISQTALVAIAVQSGSNQMLVVREEWGRLLNRLMEDRTSSCTTSHTGKRSQRRSESETPTPFCPHYARGKLLEKFLSQFCQSRYHSETEFLRHAMGSLTDAIEFKVEEWTKEESESEETSEEQTTTREPPCVLSSLLMAAQVIFYFLLPRPEDSQSEEDNQRRDMLVSCGIQLIHHWNYDIASQAAKMLVLAFSYGPSEMIQDYGGALFESIKLAIAQQIKAESSGSQVVPIEPLISMLCRKQGEFGSAIMSHIFSLLSTGATASDDKEMLLYRLMATVAMASPVVAKRQQDEILKRVEKKMNSNSKFHLVASLLSCRHAHFFTPSDSNIDKEVDQLVASDPCGWDLYLLARHALATGNFKIATSLYEELSATVTTEQNYLWTSALQQVASGESILLSYGALGIPGASSALRSAMIVFQNMSTPCGLSDIPLGLAFQCRYLLLRIDFCELVGTIRKMACEMRLTNVGPKKHTRTSLHLRNAVNLLNLLATKYLALYRQYGLFMCQQSRTTLRSLHTLCCFLSQATSGTFVDELPETGTRKKNAITDPSKPKGDTSHPMVALMKHLESVVFKDMSSSVEPKIRAAAFLQVLDGVFKVPHPFPRSFVETRPLPAASFRLSLDTGASDDTSDGDLEEDEVEVPLGTPVSLVATGCVSKSMIRCAKVPFYVILLRHQISYRAQTKDGENSQGDAAETESSPNPTSLPVTAEDAEPSSTSLPPSGNFFVKVECDSILKPGVYTIETQLGCRDIRGGEWEIPIKGPSSLTIRVTS